MNKIVAQDLARIRVAVGLLGEKHHWWKTKFYDTNGQSFFDYIFPKSNSAFQICACDAIQNHLDHKVGANYYHLFRLPIQFENSINNYIRSEALDIKNEEDAKTILQQISESMSVSKSPGPKNIGSIDQIGDGSTAKVFAAEYLAAFQNSYETYPYLN